jgi:uncharacterized protein YcbK (DUF882 family)
MMSVEIKDFQPREFCCKCGCGSCVVVHKLKETLQIIRNHWGKAMIITSSRRCAKHNARVGGVGDSQHLRGTAADVTTSGNIVDFYNFIIQLYKSGKIPDLGYIQLYKDKKFVHIDVRTPKSNTVRAL